MSTQGELIFHDTVPLPEDKLPKARERAQTQKETILRLFQKYPDRWFSPYEMMDIYTQETGKRILITSVRRSITDLTKEFRLIKGGKDNQVEECQGTTNNRWRYGVPMTDAELEDWNKLLNESI